ncbi:MAG TPA: RNA methyltransferase, partial [Saprospiraceae bacterium]|nr:RNA methyltransferase [Saprospiraceae bacterium]
KYLYFLLKELNMISKARTKFIKSLQVKKYRIEEQCFVVEGAKSVSELLSSDFEINCLVCTREFIASRRDDLDNRAEIIEVTEKELAGLGSFQSNESVIAIARMKANKSFTLSPKEYGLMLDDIRDPGNLGTIIRLADWYGIRNIVASEESADFYNAKVISASMGSFCRVNVYYTSLINYRKEGPSTLYGTFLKGENVHRTKFGAGGFIVVGNEAHGISKPIEDLVDHRISIPRLGGAESLNAAIATAIVLDNLRRSQE